MSDPNRRPVHLEFDGGLDMNLPPWSLIHLEALFDPEAEPEWTHSGMAYGWAELMGTNDLEEFVYCLNEEIKRRKK